MIQCPKCKRKFENITTCFGQTCPDCNIIINKGIDLSERQETLRGNG